MHPSDPTPPVRSFRSASRPFAASFLAALALLPASAFGQNTNITAPYVFIKSITSDSNVYSPAVNATDAIVGNTVTIEAGTDSGTRMDFHVDGVLVGTDTSAPFTAQWDTTTFPAGDHVITATARATISTVPAVKTSSGIRVKTTGTVPAPWRKQDIGAVGTPGSATATNGVFSVSGSGTLIGASDRFHFVRQPLVGDEVITAQVSNVTFPAGGMARAGVMIREDSMPGSRFCAVYLLASSSGTALTMEARSVSGTNTTTIGNLHPTSATNYVRLVRRGQSFTGARSYDGVTWTDIGTIPISMDANGAGLQAGLAVSSEATAAAQATFSNVLARNLVPQLAPTLLADFENGAATNWLPSVAGAWSITSLVMSGNVAPFPSIGSTHVSPNPDELVYTTNSTAAQSIWDTSTSVSNYALRFAVRLNTAGASAKAGAVYNWTQSGPTTRYYKLLVNSAGGVELKKNTGAGETDAVPPAPAGSFPGYYTGMLNVPWVDVEIFREGIFTTVWVNGTKVFDKVPQTDAELAAGGKIGLVTSGTTASFDNVSVTPTPVAAYSEDLSDGQFQGVVHSAGNWALDAAGQFYKTTASHARAVAVTNVGPDMDAATTIYTCSASVVTPTGGATNKVGVVYNYASPGNFYQFTLRGDGWGEFATVKNGTIVSSNTTAAPPLTAGPGKWNTITILRNGSQTSVNVNGRRAYSNYWQNAQTDFGGVTGRVGFVAENHNDGRFDNLAVTIGFDPYKKTFPKLGGCFIDAPWNHIAGPTQWDSLARFDFIVLPVWATYNTYGAGPQGVQGDAYDSLGRPIGQHQAAKEIKQRNPSIVMGTYSAVFASRLEPDAEDDISNKLNDPQAPPNVTTASPVPSNWWLWEPGGTVHTMADRFMRPAIKAINFTSFTRVDPFGWRYPQWYAAWRHTYFISITPEYDFTYNDIHGMVAANETSEHDHDINGVRDDRFPWAHRYRRATAHYLMKAAQLKPTLHTMGNIGGQFEHGGHPLETPEYQNLFNAALYEGAIGIDYSNEANASWDTPMDGYRNLMDNTRFPKLVQFMGKGRADGTAWNDISNPMVPFPTKPMAVMRYELASALMEDGYFCYNSANYVDIFWFPEFAALLGLPVDPPQRAPFNATGVYQRRFQNGLAVLNPRKNPVLPWSGRDPIKHTVPSGYKYAHGPSITDADLDIAGIQIAIEPGEGVILVTQ